MFLNLNYEIRKQLIQSNIKLNNTKLVFLNSNVVSLNNRYNIICMCCAFKRLAQEVKFQCNAL